MQRVARGVTAPQGFSAAGVYCGIKRRGKDLALIVSDRPCSAAGTLTTNALKAPCVLWAAQVLRQGKARAIVANSGNANCCTGARGTRDLRRSTQMVSSRLSIPAGQVLVASTGVIGRFLPMERVGRGIRQAAESLSATGSRSAAEAILTTDTRPKEIALRFSVGKRAVTVGGIAKGSGMIAPNMATLLAFLTTDASISSGALRRILRAVVPETFNAVTVDGETSTNDMVLFLANGAAGAAPLRPGTDPYRRFAQAAGEVCRYLAHEIARDGEGVTRLFTVCVTGAASRQQGQAVARRVAHSLLVKTMVAGRDPNWGRVAAAVGAVPSGIRPDRLTLRLGKSVVFRHGEPARLRRGTLLKEVDRPEVFLGIDLGLGRASVRLLSTDLTEEYVRINAKYTT